MKVISIVESKRWKNLSNGHTASVYGAVPYRNEAEKRHWIVEVVGYTWQLDNGTIGLGRAPVKTMAEALEVMSIVNSR